MLFVKHNYLAYNTGVGFLDVIVNCYCFFFLVFFFVGYEKLVDKTTSNKSMVVLVNVSVFLKELISDSENHPK